MIYQRTIHRHIVYHSICAPSGAPSLLGRWIIVTGGVPATPSGFRNCLKRRFGFLLLLSLGWMPWAPCRSLQLTRHSYQGPLVGERTSAWKRRERKAKTREIVVGYEFTNHRERHSRCLLADEWCARFPCMRFKTSFRVSAHNSSPGSSALQVTDLREHAGGPQTRQWGHPHLSFKGRKAGAAII